MSPGSTIDASSSHEPKYATAFADAAGALVEVVAVTGDPRPLCDARDGSFGDLSFDLPAAPSLRPCANAGPVATHTPSKNAMLSLRAITATGLSCPPLRATGAPVQATSAWSSARWHQVRFRSSRSSAVRT